MSRTDYQPTKEELLELIELNGKRIEFLCGYEDLGCDGTQQELEACRGWLETYQLMLKEIDDNERGSQA
jgi:hypothetical protein